MKKIMMTALALIFATTTFAGLAENYEPVRVETGLIIPIAPATGAWGFGYAIEPKINITDNIAAGVRAEWGVGFGTDFNDDLSVFGYMCYLAKGEYIFTQKPIRPYAGLGLGVMYFGEVSANPSDGTIVGGTFFDLVPAVGVDLKGFRIGLGVNMVFAEVYNVDNNTGIATTDNKIRPVISIDLTKTIGGRKTGGGGMGVEE